MTSLTCRQCSATFERTPRKRGPLPRYCSDSCRMAAGGYVVNVHGHNGYKHGCRCETCTAGARDGMRTYFQNLGGNPHRKSPEKYPCQGGCGKQLRGGMCRDCTPVVKASLARRRRAIASLARAAQGTAGTRPWVQGHCADCGDGFTRRSNGRDAPYCSNTCRRRVARGARRALEAGCKITPGRRYEVHERDDWTCKLCGFPVNREAVVPDLEAPVIDHIVSLARGGAHGPGNWQTAHFICNSYKRDLDMAAVA